MNCVGSIIKYILFLFNLIFVVCGILLIVLGSLVLSDIKGISNLESAWNMATLPILIIILGSVIFLIAFFGCCGAIRENKCCTTTYSVAMFVLFALQIALVVWVFVKREQFLKAMDDLVKKAWEENDSAHGYPMDFFQLSFKCCGLNSSKDYTSTGKDVPLSCCGLKVGQCLESDYSSKPGCQPQFLDFWESKTNIIRWAGMGVALIELVAFIFACILLNSFRRNN